jgi:PAS domain S-box-containing protein
MAIINWPHQFFDNLARVTDDPLMMLATPSPTVTTQAQIINVTQNAASLMGLESKMVLQQRLASILSTDINPDASWRLHHFELHKNWEGPVRFRHQNGSNADLILRITRIGYDAGYYFYVIRFVVAAAESLPAVAQSPQQSVIPDRLETVLRAAPAGIFRVQVAPGPDFLYISANIKHEEIAGQFTTDIAGKTPEQILPPEYAQAIRKHYLTCYETQKPIVYEIFMELPTGPRWQQTTLVPIVNSEGIVIELVGVSNDITDRKMTAEVLADKIDQQAAIAELGQLALAQLELPLMLEKATQIIARALHVEFCKIQEYSSNEQMLILRAGVGWGEGLVGTHISSVWDNTQAAATLKSLNPVIVEDFDQDTRYVKSDLFTEHKIKSGLAVVISGLSGPYGILSVHSTDARAFEDDQIAFLQGAADTLASAVKNFQTERALRESERLVSSILDSTQIGIGVSDASGRFVRVNQAFCKIYGYESRDLLGARK